MRVSTFGTGRSIEEREVTRAPYRSVQRRGTLSHGSTLRSLGLFTAAQAKFWAVKLDKLVAAEKLAGGHRSPEAILIGLGMDDEDGREQVLAHYSREFEQ